VKVSVNFDLCKSNAVCMDAAPTVFEVRDDGYLYVLQEEPGEDLRTQVETAAATCPTQAITVEG
jgi:ferredoxin